MANLKHDSKQNIVLKVTPFGEIPKPDVPEDWTFKGKNWKAGPKKGTKKMHADDLRKVMMVKYIGRTKPRKGESGFPSNGEATFLIDIPKHFFDSKGNFSARPLYANGDTLHVLWTGRGTGHSGWIDMNYQERGGNGGGDSDAEVACAKWS
jgi:hypothetical protein